MSDAAKQKPLLFGNMTLDATAIDDIEKFEEENFDWSYVPGYSEQRRLNEHAVRAGRKPIPIDKLYWARAARVDGTNVDQREAVTVQRLGYRACTVDDLRERGWGMPPSGHVSADGTIRHMDTVLAIVDNERGQRNAARQARINADFEQQDLAPEGSAGFTDVKSELQHAGRGSLRDARASLPTK